MDRLQAASEAVRSLFPNGLADVYAGVTHLGNPAVLTLLLALVYWGYRREETATVVGYAFLAFALTLFFKELFALPRPPVSDRLVPADGYAFPSGHSVASIVVYGGIALEFDWFDEPPKAVLAGGLAVAIGLSRVVLGVHYLGDVLAGFALGLAVLALGHHFWRHRPAVGYALGAVAALGAVVVSGGNPEAVGIVGSCLGGVAGCRVVRPLPADRGRAELALLLAVGLAVAAPVVVARLAFESSPVAQFGLGVLIVAGILGLPAALDRVGAFEAVRDVAG